MSSKLYSIRCESPYRPSTVSPVSGWDFAASCPPLVYRYWQDGANAFTHECLLLKNSEEIDAETRPHLINHPYPPFTKGDIARGTIYETSSHHSLHANYESIQWTTHTAETVFDVLAPLQKFAQTQQETTLAGFLSYEFGHLVNATDISQAYDIHFPLVHLALYTPHIDAVREIIAPIIKRGTRQKEPRRATLASYAPFEKNDYSRAIHTIKDYLQSGDIYQLNYTRGFSERLFACASVHTEDETAIRLYDTLKANNPAPFSAYLDCGDFEIISASPELFLAIDDRAIVTSPIKGTISRGSCETSDRVNQDALLSSEKNAAELLMICDLERHDLGKICETGSIRVLALKELQRFPTLYHLVSPIAGTLKQGVTPIDALRHMFPSGSITGAPKKRAMELIQHIEKRSRGVYTGCIGYIRGTEARFNIAIRTMLYQNGHVHFQSGGGITIDSDAESEYDELLLKASALKTACDALKTQHKGSAHD